MTAETAPRPVRTPGVRQRMVRYWIVLATVRHILQDRRFQETVIVGAIGVVALAQVASKIKVAHAGPGGRRSNHPRVLVPTRTSEETIVYTLPTMVEGARSVCLGRLTIENLRSIYSTIYRSSGDGAMLIRGQQTGSCVEFVGFGQVF